MRPAQDTWQAALGQLQLQVNKPNFNTWFARTTGLSAEGGEFVVGVPNSFVAEYLEQNQCSRIEAALRSVSQQEFRVSFRIAASVAPVVPALPMASSNLSPRYTFDNFIVGACNRMAHAAALAAARHPGQGYNPLYIYGDSGLGKTHLLQAIGNMARENDRQALYLTAEQFTTEYVTAIRSARMDDFHRRYRGLDLLLIDDIQFLAGKEQTVECFFHTFNELRGQNHQIVVAADAPPALLSQFEDRLRSRFEWGLTACLQAPDPAVRRTLLATRAAAAGVPLNEDTLDFLAAEVRQNVRQLEGSLNRVLAYARLLQAQLTPQLAALALGDIGTAAPPARQTPPLLLAAVAAQFQTTIDNLTGPGRDKETALARQVAMFLLKSQQLCSLAEIGRVLGGRSASTVSHACSRIETELAQNAFLKRQVDEIERRTRQAQPPFLN